MKFDQKLIPAKLIKRYKRFLADVELENGEVITVLCPNTGSMKTCNRPGWKVLLSSSDNPKRKYRHTWEMVHNGKCWIGINTGWPNKLAEEAIRNSTIKELLGYEEIKREQKYGQNSRIDLLLLNGEQRCYVEVKNVTLVEEDGHYAFPDAVTSRGLKHLRELTAMVKQGHRSVMLYVLQRSDGDYFVPAKHIDPAYAEGLIEAHRQGVEILVYRADVQPESICLVEKIEFKLS